MSRAHVQRERGDGGVEKEDRVKYFQFNETWSQFCKRFDKKQGMKSLEGGFDTTEKKKDKKAYKKKKK